VEKPTWEAVYAPLEPKILTVDDNPANLLALDAVLEPIGVEIIRAGSGREALRELLTHGDSIAVMLLDVQMPELDGFETADLVRSRESLRHLPIIFITAVNREEAHIDRGYAQDAVDYIVKPFNPESLRAKVRFFVAVHRRSMSLERQRRLTEHRLALALEAVELAVWGWESRTGVVTCDERGRTLLGVPRGEPVQLGALGLPSVDQLVAGAKLRTEVLAPSGRWLLAQARAYREADGGTRIVGVLGDISDEKQGQREREFFLGALGHDLRNPLNAIMMTGSALADYDDPTLLKLGGQIVGSAQRMAALISDMLDFVRSRAGGVPISRRSADMNAIIRDVIAEVEIAHKTTRIAFHPADSAVGLWDPGRLGQIVQNLVTNALRHGDPDETVRVAVRGRGDQVLFEVVNAGVPIPLAIRSRIFEPFVQAGGNGYGLGLYITKQLVEAHGGHIELLSLDRQTTFRVTLPKQSHENVGAAAP
jgi:signal transduction histidine kinase